MPYICLTRSDIPDGILQLTDLWPNTSKRNASIDPPGQTRYINRVQNDVITLASGSSGERSSTYPARGLAAYIADRVAPGGTEAATATVTFATAAPADTVTLGGVVFTCVAGAPTAANQEFQSTAGAGTDILAAATLVATLNDAATDALLLASPTGGSTVTAANAGTAVVTITADTVGPVGSMPLESSDHATLDISTLFLSRTMNAWMDATLLTGAAAIIARLDAGLTLTETDINTALNAIVGVSGVDIVHASGSSTHRDFLEILSGRGYSVAAGAQFASSSARWDSALAPVGSFTNARIVNDSQMLGGEWRPNTIGGDSSPVEKKGVRYIAGGGSLTNSFSVGEISVMRQAVNTLFPDSDLSNFIVGPSQPGPVTAEVTNARLVTCYNDDGTLVV